MTEFVVSNSLKPRQQYQHCLEYKAMRLFLRLKIVTMDIVLHKIIEGPKLSSIKHLNSAKHGPNISTVYANKSIINFTNFHD